MSPACACAAHSYPQLDPEQEEVLFNLEGSLLLPGHTGGVGGVGVEQGLP
jgi:hypothetical protein